MKIILREDIHGLGASGELVTVRDGYARNYLLPKKLAVAATDKNVRQMEHEKRVIAAHQAKLRASATAVAEKLAQADIKIARKVGDQDKLYGSMPAARRMRRSLRDRLNARARSEPKPAPI